jgi:hypothetical protein
MQLAKKRKVDKETNAKTWTLSKKESKNKQQVGLNQSQDGYFKGFSADFNFLKIQLISTWV